MYGAKRFADLLIRSTLLKKEELIAQLREHGDCIIDFRSPESNKLKYNVCTIDFSTPYIAAKQNRAKETEDTVLLFCWDTDSFRLVKVANVVKVEPLSVALQRSRGNRGAL
jgi:hypothetical protein